MIPTESGSTFLPRWRTCVLETSCQHLARGVDLRKHHRLVLVAVPGFPTVRV